jgi:hypothetical protein
MPPFTPESVMAKVDRSGYPWWVRLALFGSRTRSQVMSYFWMTLVLAAFCVGAGLWLRSESPVFRVPSLLFLAGGPLGALGAALYWFAARWVDRHGEWEPRGRT